MAAELLAERVGVAFAGVRALDEVDLRLRSHEIVGLIGPNGAGKTTLVNVLSGYQAADAGSISLDGRPIRRPAPDRLARTGLVRTFQAVRLFSDLTVGENLEAAALASGARRRAARRRRDELLRRLDLDGYGGARAGSLPYGAERRVSIARALATDPRFVLLDEPAAGLNDEETAELAAVVRGIRDDFDAGVLIIEHDMRLIMAICDRIQVLAQGRTIAVGTPEQIRVHPGVRAAYLGAEAASC